MSKTYDPAKITLNFLGSDFFHFAEGTFISVEITEDSYTPVVGSTGEEGWVRSHNQSGTVTLTLMGTSLANDVLSVAHAADRLTNTGQGPLLIKTTDGGTTVFATQSARVVKYATIEYGNEMPTREWVIGFTGGSTIVGGIDTL